MPWTVGPRLLFVFSPPRLSVVSSFHFCLPLSLSVFVCFCSVNSYFFQMSISSTIPSVHPPSPVPSTLIRPKSLLTQFTAPYSSFVSVVPNIFFARQRQRENERLRSRECKNQSPSSLLGRTGGVVEHSCESERKPHELKKSVRKCDQCRGASLVSYFSPRSFFTSQPPDFFRHVARLGPEPNLVTTSRTEILSARFSLGPKE